MRLRAQPNGPAYPAVRDTQRRSTRASFWDTSMSRTELAVDDPSPELGLLARQVRPSRPFTDLDDGAVVLDDRERSVEVMKQRSPALVVR